MSTALVALLVTASGCSALPGSGGPGEEIAQQAQESMQDVESYEFQMDLTSSGAGQSVSMNADGAIDQANERLRMDMDVSGQQTTTYVVDTQYGQPERRLAAGRRRIPGRLESTTATRPAGTVTRRRQGFLRREHHHRGRRRVRTLRRRQGKQLMETIQQQQGSTQGISQISLDNSDYTMYVTHGDYRIKQIDADMTMSAAGENVDATMSMTFSTFDGDLSIELPPEAQNAGSAS